MEEVLTTIIETIVAAFPIEEAKEAWLRIIEQAKPILVTFLSNLEEAAIKAQNAFLLFLITFVRERIGIPAAV